MSSQCGDLYLQKIYMMLPPISIKFMEILDETKKKHKVNMTERTANKYSLK